MRAPTQLELALDNIVGAGAQHEHTCDRAEHDDDSECIWCEARAALHAAFDERLFNSSPTSAPSLITGVCPGKEPTT